MSDEPETTLTWGYRDNGEAQLFNLAKGEKLPEGWHKSPKPKNHPNDPNFGKEGHEVEFGNAGDKITIRSPNQFSVVNEKPKRKHR